MEVTTAWKAAYGRICIRAAPWRTRKCCAAFCLLDLEDAIKVAESQIGQNVSWQIRWDAVLPARYAGREMAANEYGVTYVNLNKKKWKGRSDCNMKLQYEISDPDESVGVLHNTKHWAVNTKIGQKLMMLKVSKMRKIQHSFL